MKITVLFEDQDLVVISKPPGIVVNQADSVSRETIQDWFQEYCQAHPSNEDWQSLVPADFDANYGSPQDIFQQRRGLVHRLDKDTSGILVLAKNPGSLVNLLAQFKKRQTKKKYLCLTHGGFSIPEDTIKMPLGRASGDRKKFAVAISGRPAITHYKVVNSFAGLDFNHPFFEKLPQQVLKELRRRSQKIYQGFSLVECSIETGRTHQIRVHMASIKHPLVGDSTYVGRKRAKLDKIWCKRHFLHAQELTVTHPRTGKEQVFVADLSTDLKQVLELLK